MPLFFPFGLLLNGDYNIGKNTSNVTDCPFGVHWIWTFLGDCVSSPQEQVSAYLGIVSLLTWMLVGVPQMVKNSRNIEGLSGVCILLLIQWAGGDITNLIGAILTSQLKLQIYLACYFVLTDIVLLIQYSVFILRRRRKRKEELRAAADPTPRLILCLMGLVLFSHGMCFQKLSLSLKGTIVPGEKYDTFEGHISRSLLNVRPGENRSFLLEPEQWSHLQMDGALGNDILRMKESLFWHDKVTVLGYVIGIMSSVFYLGSRLAQIYKNKRLQSTQGLAVLTFVLAVIGNLTYGAQILVRDVSTEFLLEKTPWLFGSLGVVVLDCILLFQFHYYRLRHLDIPEISRALLNKEYIINAEDSETNDYIY